MKIVSGSFDQAIRMWDVESGKKAMGVVEGHTETDKSFQLLVDNRLLIVFRIYLHW